MTISEFRETVRRGEPPMLPAPLMALWYDASGDWNGAHRAVQDDPSDAAAWVHAYLHRKEGDASNARYWYARAGRPVADVPLAAEWEAIVASMLEQSDP